MNSVLLDCKIYQKKKKKQSEIYKFKYITQKVQQSPVQLSGDYLTSFKQTNKKEWLNNFIVLYFKLKF